MGGGPRRRVLPRIALWKVGFGNPGALLGRRGAGLAFVAYTAAWLLLIGRHAVVDPAHICSCDGGPDPGAYMWGLVWWPHALAHGLNPLVSHDIWTPQGTNLAAVAPFMPGPGLVVAPITELFGPIASYNLLNLLGPVLAAWFAFLLCRYLTRAWLPSLLGGYVFGFSSYELGGLIGHLHLVWIFLIPAALHLTLLRLHRRISARRFTVLMACIIALQVLSATEILLTMLIFGAMGLALAYWLEPGLRADIAQLVRQTLLAGIGAAVVVSPYLYYALRQRSALPWGSIGDEQSTDPLNYVLPTPVTWLGHQAVSSVSSSFNSTDGGAHGNFSESGAYIGIALVAIVLWYLLANRGRRHARVMFGALVVVVVSSLGAHLHVAQAPKITTAGAAYHPSIPLPWRLVSHVAVVNRALPVRFTIFVFLVVGVTLALWLAEPTRRRWPRWLLAAIGVAALLPNPSATYWRGRPTDPTFFTSGLYKRYIPRNSTVLIFPYAYNGNSMLWQAQTHMYFKMAGGYAGQETPTSYAGDPVTQVFLNPFSSTVPAGQLPAAIRRFITERGIRVVIDASGAVDAWQFALASDGLQPYRAGHVIVYTVPSTWHRG